MDDPQRMGVVKSIGHPGNQFGGLEKRQAAGLEVVAQGDALDEVRDDGGQAIKRCDFVYGQNVRMAELGGSAGLAAEALAVGGAIEQAGVRDFQGDEAA